MELDRALGSVRELVPAPEPALGMAPAPEWALALAGAQKLVSPPGWVSVVLLWLAVPQKLVPGWALDLMLVRLLHWAPEVASELALAPEVALGLARALKLVLE